LDSEVGVVDESGEVGAGAAAVEHGHLQGVDGQVSAE